MALRARKLSGAFEKRAPGLEPGPLAPGMSTLIIALSEAREKLLPIRPMTGAPTERLFFLTLQV